MTVTSAPASNGCPAATVTSALRAALLPYGSKPALAKAAAAIDYTVPGLVAPIAQPSGMTCWATVTTMMIMWREQASLAIPTALGRIGAADNLVELLDIFLKQLW